MTLRYSLPAAAVVTAAVFDLNGRRVATLRHGPVAAGEHDLVWDGRSDAGQPVAPGVYIVRLATPAATGAQKVVVVK